MHLARHPDGTTPRISPPGPDAPLARPGAGRTRNQRGVLIIWLALFLLILLGFVALGMDVAKAIATKTQLQNAADAAALAGASAIDSLSGAILQPEAIVRAQSVAAKNSAYQDTATTVNIDAADITFATVDGLQQVTVWARREGASPMVTAFAQVFGYPTVGLRAHATAQVARAGKVCDLVPLGLNPPPDSSFIPGCQNVYQLKAPGGGGSNGNYGFVDFPSCDAGPCGGMNPTGANTMKCLIANGFQCCFSESAQINTEPGNKSGPFLSAMQSRFKADTDQRQGICYSEYHGNNERVVTVPEITPPGSGRTNVTVTGFANFFLRDLPGSGNNSTITGEFLYMTSVGGGGSGGGPGGSGTGVYVVSLVQ